MKVINPKSHEHNEEIDKNRALASGSNSSPDELAMLSEEDDFLVKSSLAKNLNTPNQLFEKLSNDDNIFIRFSVANNPNTPGYILEKLASEAESRVKIGVGGNPNSPPQVLWELSNDKDPKIVQSVVSNRDCPAELLIKILRSKSAINEQSFSHITNNHPTDLVILFDKLLDEIPKEISEEYLGYIARNKNTPISILEKLIHENIPSVKTGLARNENTPLNILNRLSEENNTKITDEFIANQNLPKEILERLILRNKISPKNTKIVLAHPNMTNEILVEFIERSRDNFSRQAIKKIDDLATLKRLKSMVGNNLQYSISARITELEPPSN